jgi:hypothetical protein
MTRVEYYILHSAYPPNSSIIIDRATGGIPAGSTGRVVSINRELDLILVKFDNGDLMSLIYGEDYFHRNIEAYYRY